MKRNKKDNLLYTKLNKNTYLYEYYYNTTKNRYRYNRHSKDMDKANKKNHKSNTNCSYSRIYDYSPLYKFLLKNVGNNWNEIFRVCQSKLNDMEPITKMVINVNTRGLVIDNVDTKNINQYTPYLSFTRHHLIGNKRKLRPSYNSNVFSLLLLQPYQVIWH